MQRLVHAGRDAGDEKRKMKETQRERKRQKEMERDRKTENERDKDTTRVTLKSMEGRE